MNNDCDLTFLQGQEIMQKTFVGTLIAQGSQGSVFDIKCPEKGNFVIKIGTNIEEHEREIQVHKSVRKVQKSLLGENKNGPIGSLVKKGILQYT